MVWAERYAHDMRVPLVRLVDGTGGGGSVKTLETMGFSYVPPLPGFDLVVANLSIVSRWWRPRWGPSTGLGAARVVTSHFSVIVRGSAQLFVAGPPVVAAAMGESPDKEQLGGSRAQTRAGAVDNEAADEDDAADADHGAFSPTCRPTRGRRLRRWPPDDPPERREPELLSVVPRDRPPALRDAGHSRSGPGPALAAGDRAPP